jgi:hypothetical protein
MNKLVKSSIIFKTWQKNLFSTTQAKTGRGTHVIPRDQVWVIWYVLIIKYDPNAIATAQNHRDCSNT